MTIAPDKPTTEEVVVPEGHVKLIIDGETVIAPKGELLIRTAERLGTVIPRFCDHPLLEPAGACRQCLVEVEMGGRPMPKPQASCTMTVADGMVVKTQLTSPVADKAQQGVMELLLINHPLDCPVCDKGGECPLQNQAIAHGRSDSRFHEHKRTFPKPINISTQVLLDRERCVLCQRCTRFSAQIAGDPFIELLERGSQQQIGVAQDKPFQSYFSGNTIQICPVGALTSAAYRFRARPFDLVSTPSVCEHCSSGCAERTDWRRGKVQRKLAGDDPQVNEEWICDKGRFAFRYATADDRIKRPLVRDKESGELRESSWTEALQVAAAGLAAARDANGVGVLTGGRLTVEDAYAYSKFARIALHTNDIDFRARPHSAEELEFLSGTTVFTNPDNGVTFQGIESAPAALLVAFEPEEEAPVVFLRLRKAARKGTTKVFHLGQFTTPAVEKTFGTLLACVPGAEANAINALPEHASDVVELLSKPGAVILVGERAAAIPGAFTAVARLAERTGAQVAWIPRRAGERGALAVGATPNLLPGGRHVANAVARTEVERTWGVEEGSLPATPGRDTTGILEAAANGELSGLLVGGVDPFDLPDPRLAEKALAEAGFIVSLELRPSAVTAHADVVLPIAPAVEKAGSYLNWEGRRREFGTTLDGTSALPDCRVLDTLAVEMDADLFTQTPAAAAADLARLGEGTPSGSSLNVAAPLQTPAGPGKAVLATWHRLLGNGSLQVDEPHLAGTARPVVAKVAEATAQQFGLETGGYVTVSTDRGAITLPVETDDLPEGVIWLPTNSGDVTVRATLGAGHGSIVSVSGGSSFGVKS
ncbi:NADH-quinone oxidoreductase subunit G [Lentzea albidocapillata]|uniref:NADH-quinone oxidoreductase n=1 Tax=Lentzea albidocapillata TaxID=40571 RepID=A0A1W2AYH7_9PSEU|nr:NADH-quinone oxidoreductase subunit G [Lentzea albidocapillata]SMC65797.1 NADH dehydrogenase subunit G [Lentzea albidocapillata]